MRKLLMIAVLALMPFVAQAQTAPQAPAAQMPSMAQVSDNAMLVAVVAASAAVGAIALPVVTSGVFAAAPAVAEAGVVAWRTSIWAAYAYPFISGAGAALGALVGFSIYEQNK